MKILPKHCRQGFTLFELIAVLALISIFTVIAVVRHSASDATLTAQTQVLAAHIRYARMRAMNTDIQWGIHYHYNAEDKGDCYYLLFKGGKIDGAIADADIAVLPGESHDKIFIGRMGIGIAAAVGSDPPQDKDFRVIFDGWGRPASSLGGGEVSRDTLTLRLSQSGRTARNLVITKNTGFVQ